MCIVMKFVNSGPLTPSHLVMGRRLLSQAPVVRDETDTPAGNGSLSRNLFEEIIRTFLEKMESRVFVRA